MGRTNWGPIVGGIIVIGGAALVLTQWNTRPGHRGWCAMVNGCGWFGGGGAFGGVMGSIFPTIPGTDTINTAAINKGKVVGNKVVGSKSIAGASTPARGTTAITPSNKRLFATGSAGIGAGAGASASGYTSSSSPSSVNSFATITLNKLSVR